LVAECDGVGVFFDRVLPGVCVRVSEKLNDVVSVREDDRVRDSDGSPDNECVTVWVRCIEGDCDVEGMELSENEVNRVLVKVR